MISVKIFSNSNSSFLFLELVEILMDHGAQVILPDDHEIKDENANKCHLLHFATDDGFTDIARLLIEKGKIPVNTIDQKGWSPLHLAAGHNYLDILTILLEHGAEVNIKVKMPSIRFFRMKIFQFFRIRMEIHR